MSFDEHISTIVKKANSIAGMIRRTFVHLDKKYVQNPFFLDGLTSSGIWCTNLESTSKEAYYYNRECAVQSFKANPRNVTSIVQTETENIKASNLII